MSFFGDILGMSDPVGGKILGDSLGLNDKKKKYRLGKKGQKKIDLYNAFIRGGVDLQEELQPRIQAIEDQTQQSSASLMAEIYRDTIGPQSREMSELASRGQREADLEDLRIFGPQYTQAFREAQDADPREVARKGAEDELLDDSLEQFRLGAEMDPRELRRVQQLSRTNRSGQGFGQGSENDLLHEALALQTRGEELRGQRRQGLQSTLSNRSSFDPMTATLGRTAASLPFAQGAAGQSSSRLAPYSAIEPTYGSDLLNAYYADLFSARNQATAKDASKKALYGAAIGAVGSAAGGAAAFCWVAREVYGESNPKWIEFRNWLLTRAPHWLVQIYTMFGPELAEWLKVNEHVKPAIREWMDDRIAEDREYSMTQRHAI